jgi:hypothetical protein
MELYQIQPRESFKSCLKDWPLYKRLGDEFNDALCSVKGSQLIYDALSVIEIIAHQAKLMINKGEIQIECLDYSVSELAWSIALDDFMFNYEGYYIRGAPAYNYARLEENDRS